MTAMSSLPGSGCRTAPSSPMPVLTPATSPLRTKYSWISSNSSTALCLYFVAAQGLRGKIEAGIDVLVTVERAKAFGEIYAFVDDNPERNIRSGLQLEDADQHDTPFLPGSSCSSGAIDEGAQLTFLKLSAETVANLRQRFVKKLLINTFVGGLFAKLQ